MTKGVILLVSSSWLQIKALVKEGQQGPAEGRPRQEHLPNLIRHSAGLRRLIIFKLINGINEVAVIVFTIQGYRR